MRLFELAVLSVQKDLAMEKVEDVDFEFCRKRDGEPDPICLRRVGHREAKAGHVGAEERSNRERNLARHRGRDQDGLIGGRVDVRLAAPAEIILLFFRLGTIA